MKRRTLPVDVATIFAAPLTGSLDQVVTVMIQDPHLYEHFRERPCDRERLMELVARTTAAFAEGRDDARHALHRSLGSIYEAHFTSPASAGGTRNQLDPTLVAVQRELERAWISAEDVRAKPAPCPSDPQEFVEWLRRLVIHHPSTDHPLFHYFEAVAGVDELAMFISHETAVDGRFDDVIALAQVGLSGSMKMELASNFWDEMGNGTADLVHTTMFENLVNHVAPGPRQTAVSLPWDALASANLLPYLVLHRSNIFAALGALAAVEMATPRRFARLVRGFGRLGFPENVRQYHVAHIAIDTRHANGWFRNVIAPAVAASHEVRHEIVKGVLYRLNTSLDYCERTLLRCHARIAA